MRRIPASQQGRATGKRRRNELDNVLLNLEPTSQENDIFVKSLIDLYEKRVLCDVSFEVGGEVFSCHRLVLAASNSFLGKLVTSGMKESAEDVIHIETNPTLFRHVLDYIYGKHLEIPSSSIIPLLDLASKYCMDGLIVKLASLLKDHLSIENSCAIYESADAYHCSGLRSDALSMILSNFAATSKTVGFLALCPSLLKSILESDEIVDCDEALIFEAAVRWIDHDNDRKSHALDILSLIRFPLMDSFYLSDVIKHHVIMADFPDRSFLLMEAFEHHALVACGREGLKTIRTRRRKQSCSFTKSTILNGHTDGVSAILVLGDLVISGSWDTSVKVWSMDTFQCIKTLSDHTGTVRSLCMCGDKVISASEDGSMKVWSPGTWTCARTMEGHEESVNVLVDCRGRLASGGDDGTIKLWNAHSWQCEVTVHQAAVTFSASPVNNRTAAAVDNANDDEGEQENRAEHATNISVLSLEVFEDMLLSGGDDCAVRVWSTNNWSCLAYLRGHQFEVYAIRTFGSYIITGSVDGTLKVWKHHPLPNNSNGGSRAFSPIPVSSASSLDIITRGESGDQDLNVPDTASSQLQTHSDWQCEHTITSHGPVYSICNLENTVVTAGASQTITLWKPAQDRNDNWETFKEFRTDGEEIWSIAVCKGRLVSGGSDGVIRVWR